jgi:hypothetical protein
VTKIVGKSICGSGASGSRGKAATPSKATAAIRRHVATGRRMKGSEKFISRPATVCRANVRQPNTIYLSLAWNNQVPPEFCVVHILQLSVKIVSSAIDMI